MEITGVLVISIRARMEISRLPVISSRGPVADIGAYPAAGHARAGPSTVQRTEHTERAAVEHVRVDLGGGHVLVAQQLLHRADVGAGLQQVRGETMAQGVRGDRL